jgi:hypothetical protein
MEMPSAPEHQRRREPRASAETTGGDHRHRDVMRQQCHEHHRRDLATVPAGLVAGPDDRVDAARLGLARVAHRGDRAQHLAAIADAPRATRSASIPSARLTTGTVRPRPPDDRGRVLGSHQTFAPNGALGEPAHFANRVTNFVRRQRRRRQQARPPAADTAATSAGTARWPMPALITGWRMPNALGHASV